MKTTKEMIEVMQAYLRGEQIEFCYNNENIKVWENTDGEPMWNWADTDYRIKPKPKYVPFETPEEVIEAQGKHGSYIKCIEDGVQFNSYVNYMGYILLDDDKNNIAYSHINILYKRFVFTDGTPCGKEVNV